MIVLRPRSPVPDAIQNDSVTVKADSHRHARHDTDRTVLSCLVWWCKLSRPDRQTGASGLCRSVSGGAVRPPDALRRRTHLSGRLNSHRLIRHGQDRLVLSGGRCELGITVTVRWCQKTTSGTFSHRSSTPIDS